jgi:hypothetical protein
MVLAKKYKDPLTLDPIVYKAAASGTILTEDQLKTIKRMARDSPVLDFLNFASNISTDDLENLMGAKRSIVNIVPTDELLQELVGDDDDLIAFVGMTETSQEAKRETLNALRRSGTKTIFIILVYTLCLILHKAFLHKTILHPTW